MPAPYIPVGCIGISQQESNVSKETWLSTENRTWRSFLRHNDDLNNGGHVSTSDTPHINPSIQDSLLKSSKLSQLGSLFRSRWCKLQFCVTALDENPGIVRVYMLPDDTERRSVNRSNESLQKARLEALRSLDYSPSAWRALKQPDHSGLPVLEDFSSIDNDKDVSLLQLFNTIPSPDPDLKTIVEKYTRHAMHKLMESKVPGLKTELYPYQKKTAALMLQKEAQPGQILDPRLLHLRGVSGSHWYMDPVTGEVLSQPRYYDRVSGGILAEQMGLGKTFICLALILATKDLPTSPPDCYKEDKPPKRPRIATLVDMAASCATRHAAPGKPHFQEIEDRLGDEHSRCYSALLRNHGYYTIPASGPTRDGLRGNCCDPNPKRIYMSSASIVIVLNNLVAQWKQEIRKHTEGLKVLVLEKTEETPSLDEIMNYDIILFSRRRFEMIHKKKVEHDTPYDISDPNPNPFLSIHFKRCIVDEGHDFGNSTDRRKTDFLLGVQKMHFASRWVVTGTPSRGLYGDIQKKGVATLSHNPGGHQPLPLTTTTNQSNKTWAHEKGDVEKIGAIARHYLKARPWANTKLESGDTPADWNTYVMLPRHNLKSRGRWECLESTLNSLIIRHQISDIEKFLPPVNKKITILEGSYQDQLSRNLFAMMIVFNSVQSQREDMDYFFHEKQKKSLTQIVGNMKQASFFGGSFFTADEIAKSVETAEKFLAERRVPISLEDESGLQEAIRFGKLAMRNNLRNLTNQFHEIAVSVAGFPGNAGESWSLDGGESVENSICTSTSMLLSLQKLVYNATNSEERLNSLLNGELISKGRLRRSELLDAVAPKRDSKSDKKSSETLAGNTKMGEDRPKKTRSHGVNGIEPRALAAEGFAGPLEQTKVTATVSAKLSYLIDSLVKYKEEEKIIVFYENENVGWYLASMLDVLQIEYRTYNKWLTTGTKAENVNTFNYDDKVRVLLMDISRYNAFGVDIQAASRIFFINPVLNPQVEEQAIGRARRMGQTKPVWVETLVLKDSLDEVILERKGQMTQAEYEKAKTILDVRPIYDWIKNAKVTPMDSGSDDYASQMVMLHTPQAVFGRGFGVTRHPDDDSIMSDEKLPVREKKRPYEAGPGSEGMTTDESAAISQQEVTSQSARRVRFAF